MELISRNVYSEGHVLAMYSFMKSNQLRFHLVKERLRLEGISRGHQVQALC